MFSLIVCFEFCRYNNLPQHVHIAKIGGTRIRFYNYILCGSHFEQYNTVVTFYTFNITNRNYSIATKCDLIPIARDVSSHLW